MSTAAAELQTTPYELLGGNEAAVRRIVDAFYDLMETAPEARELRAMHAADLGPMRDRLTWFLSGWLSGPALYIERTGGGRARDGRAGVRADHRLPAQSLRAPLSASA